MSTSLSGRKGDRYERIIQAATFEFSNKGFAGARMDEIAARAKVNKATVYYHIGDKSVLYATVLHKVFGNVADRLSRSIKDDQSPEENLERYFRALIETIQENPLTPSIMLRETASGGKHLPLLVIKDFGRIFATLSHILDKGHAAGIFRKTNPIILHFTALGPMTFYARLEPIFRRYFDAAKIVPTKIDLPDNLASTVMETIFKMVKSR